MRGKATWLAATIILAVIVVLLLYRFLSPAYTYRKPAQAAFVIGFDDRYVKEWHQHRSLFRKYGVRATFFLTQPDSLSPEELLMLKELAADGHEIASHGYRHTNAVSYIRQHGLAAYMAHEIIPAINQMHASGFAPVTFSYPYGANTRRTDQELAKYFLLLRGDSWKVAGKGIAELDKIFYGFDGSRIVNGLGIDAGSGVTLTDLEAGFKRAAANNEAIVLYAHSINKTNDKYSISPLQLETIFKSAREYKLKSLAFKELVL